MNTAHRGLLKVTFGKVGWGAMGMPVLELTTIGRRSGQSRTVMLTSPLQQNGSMVVVASRGGDNQHPSWFLNLRDEPTVQVSVKGAPVVPMTARVAFPAERALMWPKIAAKYQNYAGYQERTSREIPLVLLEPA